MMADNLVSQTGVQQSSEFGNTSATLRHRSRSNWHAFVQLCINTVCMLQVPGDSGEHQCLETIACSSGRA